MTLFEEWAKKATDPREAAAKPKALPGIRVLELTPGHVGGMVAASILGEFGAEVIKVEPPGGDPARGYAPEGILLDGVGLPFLAEARNRKFVTLATDAPEGRALLCRLAVACDVIVTTLGASRMEEEGIGYLALSRGNPGLIFVSLSVYGAFGPKASRPVTDSDIVCQALCGAANIVGEPEEEGAPAPHRVPTRLGNWHGWFIQGLWGAFGALAALSHRAASGKGQFVDVSGAEGLMKFCDYNITWMHTAGKYRSRLGNFDPAVFPYTYIRCRDGHTFMAAYNDDAFESLMTIIGRPALAKDPRFSTAGSRVKLENERALQEILEEWSSDKTADEILREIEDYTSKKSGPGAAVVTGRVNRPLETLSEENWNERGCFVRHADPARGELVLAAPPWKMSLTPPRIESGTLPAGADNADVFGALLGLGPSGLADLASRGIV